MEGGVYTNEKNKAMYLLRAIFLFGFILSTVALSAQRNIVCTGQIIDLYTQQGIPDVYIKSINQNVGSVSDSLGYFKITIDTNNEGLTFSHINYESTALAFSIQQDTNLNILLIPSENILEEVLVLSKPKPEIITDKKTYSTVDFLVYEEYLFLLNYYGIQKGYQLEVTKFDGTPISSYPLKNKYKKPEKLHLSCQNTLYLVCYNEVYEYFFDKDWYFFPAISFQLFDTYVSPCFGANEQFVYYEFTKYNDLFKGFQSYHKKNKSEKQIRVIYDSNQLNNFFEEKGKIRFVEKMEAGMFLTMEPWDMAEEISNYSNTLSRHLQAEVDFLKNVFFKLKFPIPAFQINDKIHIFNHIENTIEHYDDYGNPKGKTPINYPNLQRWSKKVVLDKVRQNFYTFIENKQDYTLCQISLKDGQLHPITTIELAHFEKTIIHNGILFVLESDDLSNKRYVKMVQLF